MRYLYTWKVPFITCTLLSLGFLVMAIYIHNYQLFTPSGGFAVAASTFWRGPGEVGEKHLGRW